MVKKHIKNYLLYNIFVCVSVLIFFTSANAKDAHLNELEGDVILIPAGSFLFGTNKKDDSAEALSLGLPKAWYADEGPEENIFLKEFYIDRYEVTNRRYKIYIDDLNAVAPEYWTNKTFPTGQEKFPVVNVNWYDASNFCQWAQKKLPSEKQWEKAARGETGNSYPWGKEFNRSYSNLSSKS